MPVAALLSIAFVAFFRLDGRIDRLDTRIDTRFDAPHQEIGRVRQEIADLRGLVIERLPAPSQRYGCPRSI